MDLNTYEWRSELLRNNFAAGKKAGRDEGRDEGWKEGRKEGRKEGLLIAIKSILSGRKIELSEEHLERLDACTDEAQLKTWIERAATVQFAGDIFDA